MVLIDYPIYPELSLLTGVLIYIIVGSFLNEKYKQIILPFVFFLIFAIVIACTIYAYDNKIHLLFSNAIIIDNLSIIVKTLICALVLLSTPFIFSHLNNNNVKIFEFTLLIQLSILGMFLLISTKNILSAYLGLELLSLSFYGLVALQRNDIQKVEAGMKYFIIGALASGILLYGFSLLYGYSSSLDITTITETVKLNISGQNESNILFAVVGFLLVYVALSFKVGLFPFHQWMPDVYHGANNATVLYLSIIPKAGALVFLIRMLSEIYPYFEYTTSIYFSIIGTGSIIFGSLVALVQTNLKRLLAYSTVANMGYIVLAFVITKNSSEPNLEAALFYLTTYLFTSFTVFALVLSLDKKHPNLLMIKNLKGLVAKSKIISLLFLVSFLSLAGIPPFIGFFAKFNIISHLIDQGLIFLTATVLLFSVVAAYYYLSLVKTIYFDKEDEDNEEKNQGDQKIITSTPQLIALTIVALAFLTISILPSLLYEVVGSAI